MGQRARGEGLRAKCRQERVRTPRVPLVKPATERRQQRPQQSSARKINDALVETLEEVGNEHWRWVLGQSDGQGGGEAGDEAGTH